MRPSSFPVWAQFSGAALAALAGAFATCRDGALDLVAYLLFGLALLFAGLAVWHLPSVEAALTHHRRRKTDTQRERERDHLAQEVALGLSRFDAFYLTARTFVAYYRAAETVAAPLEPHRTPLNDRLNATENAARRLVGPDGRRWVALVSDLRERLREAESIECGRLLWEVQELNDSLLELRRHYRSVRKRCGSTEPRYEIPTPPVDQPPTKATD